MSKAGHTRENEELRSRLGRLSAENELLKERAEDLLLLGAVSEKISSQDSAGAAAYAMFERIATFRDLAYCALLKVHDGLATVVNDFSAFAASRGGLSFAADASFMALMDDPKRVMSLSGQNGAPAIIPPFTQGIEASTCCLLPMSLQGGQHFCLFVSRVADPGYLIRLRPLLERACEAVQSRFHSLGLVEKIKELSGTLDERVRERTAGLELSNAMLKHSETRLILFRELIDQSNDAIYVLEPDSGYMTFCNQKGCESIGYPRSGMLSLNITGFLASTPGPEEWNDLVKRLRREGSMIFSDSLRRRDGSTFPVEVSARIVSFDGKQLVTAAARDISARNRAEEAILKSQARLQRAQEIARMGNWEWDAEKRSLYLSREMYRILDIPLNGPASLDTFYDAAHPNDREALKRSLEGAIYRGEPFSMDYRIWLPDGTERTVNEQVEAVLDESGRPSRIEGTMQDITERVRAEDIIRTALKEKDLLLKEVHHRVKNNLQVVLSLIKMQTPFLRDEGDREMLIDAQNRIKTMSIAHDILYRSRSFIDINLSEYIKGIKKSLYRAYNINENTVTLKSDIQDVPLGIDTAIPCGLIVNELLSNSLKHAFPGGMRGEINISLGRAGSKIELRVRDNGVGIPGSVTPGGPETIGFQLVFALAKQLGAEVEILRQNGTDISLRFSEIPYAKRF